MGAARKYWDVEAYEEMYEETYEQEVELKVYTNNKKQTAKQAGKKYSHKGLVAMAAVLMICFGLLYASLSAYATTVAYEIQSLESDISAAQTANNRLALEVEQLSAPARVVKFAESAGGMVMAGGENVLYVGANEFGSRDYQVAAAMNTNTQLGSGSVEVVSGESAGLVDVIVSFFAGLRDKGDVAYAAVK